MDKKLSNEEILKLIEDFYNLSDERREGGLRIERGAFKSAYKIPGSDYVLKEGLGRSGGEEIIKDYIQQKQLSKFLPNAVETPILVTREGQRPVSIQKRVEHYTSLPVGSQERGASRLNSDKMGSLLEEVLEKKGIRSELADLHEGNIGFSGDLGDPKVIDTGPFRFLDESKNLKLDKPRETIIDKLGKLNKTKVYRQIPLFGPLIGGGIAALSGDANAASGIPLLGESGDLGPEKGSEDELIENPRGSKSERLAKLKQLLGK